MPTIKKTQHIPGTLAVSFLQSLFDTVRKSGFTEEDILKAAEIEFKSAEDNHQRISGNQYCHLLNIAVEQCKDDDFGLHMGESIKPGHYGVLGYACMSSATFEETFERMNSINH